MTRDALIVGINQYPKLKDTPTSKPKDLKTPAGDAEAIAQLLEDYGDFRVQRLPASVIDGKLQIDPDKIVRAEELEEAITHLFLPNSDRTSETALLFFAGHGLRKSIGTLTQGFLATSDASPNKSLWGMSLRDLRDILQESQVRQQIVWLDCCFSGELLNFEETHLWRLSSGRDRLLIAASRDSEVAYQQLDGEHGVLTGAILKGLDPHQFPEGEWLTSPMLLVSVYKELDEYSTLTKIPQSPQNQQQGEPIQLIQGRSRLRAESKDEETVELSNIQENADLTRRALNPITLDPIDRQCVKLYLQEISNSVNNNERKVIAIIGDAGYGKTTILGNIYDKMRSQAGWVALVRCDNLSLEQKISDESIAKALGNYICNNNHSNSITDITSVLTKKHGRGLLLIDTLDLVLNLAFIEPFHRVLRELTNRELTVVFTCRDYEYDNILNPDVNLYGLASNVKRHPVPKFSNQEILQAAQVFFDKKSKNLNAINKGKAFGEEIIALSAHDYQLREIICKPLLLRMLCELFEDTGVVPKNMTVSHLYRMYWNERIAKLRYNSSGSTGIVPAKVAIKQQNICWNIAKAAFETSYERLELLVRFSDIVEEEKLDEITELAYEKLKSEGIIIADNKYVDVVRFFHQSFLEYAIALWLDKREAKYARERLLETLRSPYAWFDWWRIMREYLTIARPGEFEHILNTNLLDMRNERAFNAVAFAAAFRDDPSALYKLLPTALVQGEQYQQILFDAAISTPISHAEAAWNVILTLLREGEYKIAANIAQKSKEMLVRLKPQLGFCINEALDAIKERTVKNEV